MGRMYVVNVNETLASTPEDLLELIVPSDRVVFVHSMTISQHTFDSGDVVQLMETVTAVEADASRSGGASANVYALDPGDAATGCTVEAGNDTGIASTVRTLTSQPFNVLAGFFYRPTPEERFILGPSDIMRVLVTNGQSANMTVRGEVVFEEIGT